VRGFFVCLSEGAPGGWQTVAIAIVSEVVDVAYRYRWDSNAIGTARRPCTATYTGMNHSVAEIDIEVAVITDVVTEHETSMESKVEERIVETPHKTGAQVGQDIQFDAT